MNNFYEEFKDTTHYQKNNAFLGACIDGDLEKIKYLLTSSELSDHANIDVTDSESDYNGYLYACRFGWLDIVQYLLTSPELKYHQNIHSRNRMGDTGLQIACKYGHVNIVEYLLTSPELKEHAFVNDNDYWALHLACEHGHLEVIKYLFNSGSLKKYNINENGQDILNLACENGSLEVVKFLLTNTELKDTADLDIALFSSSWNQCIEIAQYLIMDLNAPKKNNTMKQLLQYQESFARNVENMFNARDLNQELKSDLDNHKIDRSKVKL
jgi:ankyrin repeat protein